ncbi:uncharacterized protein AB9W97_006513 [Spinachia spinachia]
MRVTWPPVDRPRLDDVILRLYSLVKDTFPLLPGVSVPAHSCILSAISPHISSALSSAPPPPAGQSRLLEFRALGACTLLNVVRLLYCGEMAGEGGEEEKQQAVLAAAKLGIHGLVEVTNERDGEGRCEEGRRTGMSVQTEAPVARRKEGKDGRWAREVTDGSVFLWKETSSNGKKDRWTQTEELLVDSDPPSHTAASFETVDMAALQALVRSDSHLAPPQIPYLPLSLIYPPAENQTHPPLSALVDSMAAGPPAGAPPHPFYPTAPLTSSSSHVGAGPVDLHSWWAGPPGAARDVTPAKEKGDKWLEQFQGNIPGYISYFLNPDEEEEKEVEVEEEGERGFVGGRVRRRWGAGQGGARRAGTGERRARRPRAKAGGRGGRGAVAQTVAVQEVRASRLHKVFLQRSRPCRAGQGGGAVGRKLNLKTRELLRAAKTGRGRGKVWEFSQSGDVLTSSGCGGAGGRGGNTQKFNQDGRPVARVRRARAKPAASVSFSSPSPSTCPPSLCLPPPAPPPHEEQPEHFERLLEEVMMGLDILPVSHSAPHPQPPPPPAVGGGCATCGDTLVQNKERRQAQSRGLHESTRIEAEAGEGATCNGELPVLQQHGEGELSEMLEHLLQSFEQHAHSCTARAAEVTGGESCQATPPRNTQEAQVIKTPPKERGRWKKNKHPFSLERKRAGKPAAMSATRRDEQLRQRPVVKLDRIGPLPDRVTPHKLSCADVKSPAKAKAGSSSVKYRRESLVVKTYPIRSRLTGAHVMNSLSLLKEPCGIRRGHAEGKPSCCPDNGNKEVLLLSLSRADSSSPTDEQLEKNRERREEERAVGPREQAEGAAKGGRKRAAGEEEEAPGDESTGVKRIRSEHLAPRMSETCALRSPSARGTEEDSPAVEERGSRAVGGSEPTLGRAEDSSTPLEESLQSAGGGEEDEDIDVIGAFGPAPVPVLISWSSEGEEEDGDEDGDEDIDVVGEKRESGSASKCSAR